MARGWYVGRIRLNKAGLRYTLQAPVGNVGRFMLEQGTNVLAAAHVEAPRDTGALSIFQSMEMDYGKRAVSATITANSPYAMFVHEGTRSPIRARSGGYMTFTWQGRQYRVREVRGQAANPWLWRALATGADRSFIVTGS